MEKGRGEAAAEVARLEGALGLECLALALTLALTRWRASRGCWRRSAASAASASRAARTASATAWLGLGLGLGLGQG